jgi:hypothetical protein
VSSHCCVLDCRSSQRPESIAVALPCKSRIFPPPKERPRIGTNRVLMNDNLSGIFNPRHQYTCDDWSAPLLLHVNRPALCTLTAHPRPHESVPQEVASPLAHHCLGSASGRIPTPGGRPPEHLHRITGFGLPLRISNSARTHPRARNPPRDPPKILLRRLPSARFPFPRLGSGDLSLSGRPRQMGTKGENNMCDLKRPLAVF